MPDPSSLNVARFLHRQAVENPNGIAVKAPLPRRSSASLRYEEVSFRELDLQSDQIARGMASRGIRAGMRTMLMVRPGSDLIRCCFALFKLGAVPVVIDPGMGLRHFLSCVRRTRPEAMVAVPLAHFISRLFPSAFKSVSKRVTVGRGFRQWYRDFSVDEFAVYTPGADDLAAILFTSGSTGSPKGVCYGHGQFDAQVRLIRDTFGIEPGEIDLPMLPIFALFNPALGMTTVVPEMNPAKPAKVEPAKILQAIGQCGVTTSFGSPVLWKKIALQARREGNAFPTVRRILMAGAPVPPSLIGLLQPVFPKATLWSPYGATECLPVTCVNGTTILSTSAGRTSTGGGTCVGKPVAGVTVKVIGITEDPIASPAEWKELPPGEIGEIIATGPTVTKAYDGLPEATRRAKIPTGDGSVWHRMGDAGYLDPEGQLWFCGRIAERVVTSDGVLYTDCCEGIFNGLPGVNRTALIGLGTAPHQEPALVVEPEPGVAVDRESILSHAAAHPLTKPIKTLFVCRSFPVDVRHNAKIHRLELAGRFSKS